MSCPFNTIVHSLTTRLVTGRVYQANEHRINLHAALYYQASHSTSSSQPLSYPPILILLSPTFQPSDRPPTQCPQSTATTTFPTPRHTPIIFHIPHPPSITTPANLTRPKSPTLPKGRCSEPLQGQTRTCGRRTSDKYRVAGRRHVADEFHALASGYVPKGDLCVVPIHGRGCESEHSREDLSRPSTPVQVLL